MSNPDSFINEVTEEVRRDRLFRLFRRYGWIGALLVLLVVGGAAVNEWRKAQARATAEGFGDAVLAALETDDRAARVAALNEIEADGGRAAVLRLLIAAEAQAATDRDAAVAALAALERDGDLPLRYRQLAALKRVIVGGRFPAGGRARGGAVRSGATGSGIPPACARADGAPAGRDRRTRRGAGDLAGPAGRGRCDVGLASTHRAVDCGPRGRTPHGLSETGGSQRPSRKGQAAGPEKRERAGQWHGPVA
jgi:hypothetical protein